MPTTSPRPFRADLEALRGIAILLVVAYHAGVAFLAGGFVGVDVLFVLSGYFTTRLLTREYGATGSVDVAAFYGRRALRLLPPLLLVVAATLALVWAVYAPIDRAAVASTARSVALGTANRAFARESLDYFSGADSPLLHAWSLAVELQVSLFGPLLFLALATLGRWTVGGDESAEPSRRADALMRGVGIGLAVAGVLSFAVAVRLTRTDPSWAFFGTPARAWEFVVGALLGLLLPADVSASNDAPDGPRETGGWLQGAGLAAIAVAVLAYDRATPYPGAAALLPVLGSAAVVAGGVNGGGILAAEGPATRALRWFGKLSYGWYLWHWPMVVVGAVLFPTMGVLGRLALSALALAPAWLTYRWVERPLRAARDEPSASPSWRSAAAIAGCVAVALSAGGLRRAAERRVAAPDQRAFAAARADRMPHECWAQRPDAARGALPVACVFGDPRATTTVALFGDSHAEHWLAALDRLGRERGWRVVLFVKGGCPVADAPELATPRSASRARECDRYRAAAIRTIVALRPAAAVLSSWDEYVTRDPRKRASPAPDSRSEGHVRPDAWRRGLRRTYARVAVAGVPVVVVRGTPRPPFDVPACLSRRADGRPGASPCVYAREPALHHAARAAQLAAVRDVASRGLPVRAIDLTDVVCATSTCSVVQDGRVVFTDDNHLTASFTRAAAGAFGARLDAALATLGVRLP